MGSKLYRYVFVMCFTVLLRGWSKGPLRTEHIFAVWNCINIMSGYSPSHITVPVVFSDCSKAVLLIQFYFACASAVSYLTFVLPLFVPHLSISGASGRLCFVINPFPMYLYLYIVDTRYLDLSYFEYPHLELKIWSLFEHRDQPTGNKILWKGEISP